jgi:hypothetical protein
MTIPVQFHPCWSLTNPVIRTELRFRSMYEPYHVEISPGNESHMYTFIRVGLEAIMTIAKQISSQSATPSRNHEFLEKEAYESSG